jgi:hypothetical protein
MVSDFFGLAAQDDAGQNKRHRCRYRAFYETVNHAIRTTGPCLSSVDHRPAHLGFIEFLEDAGGRPAKRGGGRSTDENFMGHAPPKNQLSAFDAENKWTARTVAFDLELDARD